MLDYEDTKIEKKGNICCLIFASIIIYGIIAFVILFFVGVSDFSEVLLVLLILTPFLAILILLPWINIKNSKKNREIARMIKEKGKRVKGNIKKIERTYKSNYKDSLFKRAAFFRRKSIYRSGGSGSPDSYYDYAIVEYEYDGKTKTVNTPYIDFYKEDLISKEVDVYIFEDKVYVDNFRIKRKEIKKKYKEWKKMQIKVMISFIIMLLLIAITIFLSIIGVIPKIYMPFIIVSLMVTYFILGSIIYIKYIDNSFNMEDNKTRKNFNSEEKIK